MIRFLFVSTGVAWAWAGDDPWAKVKELKTGTEIRIIRKGAPRPVLATYADLSDESLIVVEKNEQKGIPREEVERLDARPTQKGPRVVKESRATSNEPPTAEPYRPTPNRSSPGPSTSSSSGLVIGDKPDFETIYRRPTPAPKKASEPQK